MRVTTAALREFAPRPTVSAMKFRLYCAVLLAALAVTPASFAAKPAREPGAELFTNGPVLRFKIEVSKTGLDWLRKDPRRYVPAKITEGTNVYHDVGIHLKGAAGSFRGVDDKAAFTVNFDKFTPDQEFHGLDKIHLNNSVQDPSYSTEYLCGEMMHAAGVPAPRVTHARVWLNGRDLGFYTMIEGFGKEFLKRYFKNAKGTLYDGGFLQEINANLERDMGDGPNTRADLKALFEAAQEADTDARWERLGQVLDLDRFISYMAMEVMTWDWDGYPLNRNNYRIYHDTTTDKLVFMPHGMDQMFQNTGGPIRPPFNGLVAAAVMKTTQGRRLYKERFVTLFTNVFELDVLTNKLAALHARNRPALAEISVNAAREYDGQVNALRDRMTQRWQSLSKQLNQPESKPIAFTDGVAKLSQWRAAEERPAEKGHAKLERPPDGDGRPSLSIQAGTNSTASWRVKLLLEGGRYRFEGMARTAQVVPLPIKPPPANAEANQNQNQNQPAAEKKGEGAGLRISGTQKARENRLVGDTPWTKLDFEFDVIQPDDEVELVCELRAKSGQVWFDQASLRLVKVK